MGDIGNITSNVNGEEIQVSVVIPVRGGARLLEAVDSVINQTYQKWECLIIDDGIKSSILNDVKQVSKQIPQVKVIQSKGKGISCALNTGISEATGKYIARLDDDDIWADFHLELLLPFLEKNETIDVVSSLMSINRVPKDYTKSIQLINPYQMLPFKNPINHPTVILKKESVITVGGYRSDCDGFEDYDLWSRLLTTENSQVCLIETAYYRGEAKMVTWDEDQSYLRFRKRLAAKFGLSLKEVWGSKW